jgi:hypothetical protein
MKHYAELKAFDTRVRKALPVSRRHKSLRAMSNIMLDYATETVVTRIDFR